MTLRTPSRAALVLAALAAGCGGESAGVKRPTGSLKGKLTVAGVPAPAKTALVFQHAETGQLFLTQTDDAGAFSVSQPSDKLPVGRYDVTVQPAAQEDLSKEGIEASLEGPKGGKAPPPPVDIPAKYRNAHESGLGFQLEEGPNERSFDLKK